MSEESIRSWRAGPKTFNQERLLRKCRLLSLLRGLTGGALSLLPEHGTLRGSPREPVTGGSSWWVSLVLGKGALPGSLQGHWD